MKLFVLAGILGSGQEASSAQALPFCQLADELQQVHESTGRVL